MLHWATYNSIFQNINYLKQQDCSSNTGHYWQWERLQKNPTKQKTTTKCFQNPSCQSLMENNNYVKQCEETVKEKNVNISQLRILNLLAR